MTKGLLNEHQVTLLYKGSKLPDDYVALRVAEALAVDTKFLSKGERVGVGNYLYEVVVGGVERIHP